MVSRHRAGRNKIPKIWKGHQTSGGVRQAAMDRPKAAPSTTALLAYGRSPEMKLTL